MKNLRKAYQDISRHRWLSGMTVGALALIVVIFNLALTLNAFAGNTLTGLNRKVDILFNLQTNAPDFEVDNFIKNLKGREEVMDVSLVTKEEAATLFRTLHPDLSEALDRFEVENPFPTSIAIIVRSPADHISLKKYLQTQSDLVDLNSLDSENSDPASQLSARAATQLQELVDFAGYLFSWIIGVFLLSTLAITINAINLSLFTRQKEIMIMELVGASYATIRRPYMAEAMLLTTSAVIIGDVLSAVVIILAGWQDVLSPMYCLQIFGVQLAFAIIVGALSSSVATTRYLKQQSFRF